MSSRGGRGRGVANFKPWQDSGLPAERTAAAETAGAVGCDGPVLLERVSGNVMVGQGTNG